MKAEEFNAVVVNQIKMSSNMLIKKAEEYSTKNDRFHNFNVGSVELGLSRLKYAESLMQKHITSVRDMINQWNEKPFSVEHIDEKFTDSINYFILIKGMMLEDKAKLKEDE